jgi:hypothetical protein
MALGCVRGQSIGQFELSLVSVVGADCWEEISLSAGRMQQSLLEQCKKVPRNCCVWVVPSGARGVAWDSIVAVCGLPEPEPWASHHL